MTNQRAAIIGCTYPESFSAFNNVPWHHMNRNVLSPPQVLTGDKQETAINIGYSSQLLTDEQHEPFIVDGETFDVSSSPLHLHVYIVKSLDFKRLMLRRMFNDDS